MLPESNPKKSCRGSHHALRLHRNLLQSQAPPLSARLSLPTRVRKTLEQSNKPTKLNNCLSAFSKTDHSDRQQRQLRHSFERTCPEGKRDYAMTLCMLDLGLRCCEVIRL